MLALTPLPPTLTTGTLKGKTPAQAAGLSNHCWTLRELLTFNAAITSKIT